MDNFGIGHGAIKYLEEFPFSKLKVDRSLVEKLKEQPQNTAMLATLVALANNFKMDFVAEGVETQQQIEILESLNCRSMQGYRFSYPLATAEATEFLKKHHARRSPQPS